MFEDSTNKESTIKGKAMSVDTSIFIDALEQAIFHCKVSKPVQITFQQRLNISENSWKSIHEIRVFHTCCPTQIHVSSCSLHRTHRTQKEIHLIDKFLHYLKLGIFLMLNNF